MRLECSIKMDQKGEIDQNEIKMDQNEGKMDQNGSRWG